MKTRFKATVSFLKIAVGCALFSLGFNLFLEPNGLNAGGISGLSMLIVHLIGWGSVGSLTLLLNLPLFAVSGMKIGKKFVIGSLVGMLFSSVFIDLFTVIPVPQTEPLIGCVYGGVICGIGLGAVFAEGASCGLGLGVVFISGTSTGGSDIIVRFLKMKWQHIPIGSISIGFDLTVAVLTGIVFRDISRTLYSGVAIFICGKVIDSVVYSFDYSKVALIISKEHEKIAAAINDKLERGATYLDGEDYYSGEPKKIVLSAVKKHQITELKQLVVEIDPDAFIIVQEAHQVLGDGFSRYSKDSL